MKVTTPEYKRHPKVMCYNDYLLKAYERGDVSPKEYRAYEGRTRQRFRISKYDK